MAIGNNIQGEGEDAIVAMEQEEREGVDQSMSGFKNFLWHGGSVYDAWFSCASNQVIYENTHQQQHLFLSFS